MTIMLSPDSLTATRAQVDKVNARAVKRGFTGRIELVATRTVVTETGPSGLPVTKVMYAVDITGEAPRYGGWAFLAAVDALPAKDGGTSVVLRYAPGVDEGHVDRSAIVGGRCQHCGVNQPTRKYTYLVRHEESGELKQVGSTCVKDFTGWAGRPVFVDPEEVESDLLGRFGVGYDDAFTVETVLATAYAAVQTYGWRPSAMSSPTREKVGMALIGVDSRSVQVRADIAVHVDAGYEIAPTIIATLTGALTGPDGYEANLRAALNAEYVTDRQIGLLCSAIGAYDKHLGRESARQVQAVSEWIGTVGEKVTVTGTVTTALRVDGYMHGTSNKLVIVTTPAGVVKVVTAAEWAWDVAVGDQVTITGTVKDHTTYRDVKQTVLTRPKRVTT